MSGPMDIGAIADELAARADVLVCELLPAGRREGAEWVEASRARGGLGDSLRVHLAGAKAGVWSHFATGAGGDALDLVAYLVTAGDKGRAVAWSRAWLGIDGADPRALARRREASAESRRRTAEAQRAENRRRADKAFGLWLSCEERLAGTPAERYLAGRGLDLAPLGRQPRALRYHPALREPETGREHPCLVAAITGKSRIQAVHRTFLQVRPDGSVGKLSGVAAKKSWGIVTGGAVRLANGERVDPKTGEVKRGRPLRDAAPGSAVVLTEGIEDGLAVAIACPEYRVLAAVSLSNMGAVWLPDAIETVILAADNDAAGSQAALALDRAVQAHLAAGRRVKLARPPRGIKDVNELLQQGKEAG